MINVSKKQFARILEKISMLSGRFIRQMKMIDSPIIKHMIMKLQLKYSFTLKLIYIYALAGRSVHYCNDFSDAVLRLCLSTKLAELDNLLINKKPAFAKATADSVVPTGIEPVSKV